MTMPLILKDASLDWALNHALTLGDTDIFPDIFEFHAIHHDWDRIKKSIQKVDASEWKVRPFRKCLVPKHRFGFRVSTQLDPLDFLVFTAIIKDVGTKLESTRIPSIDNVVHSYRFSPNKDGRIYSDLYTYRTFQKASYDNCEKYGSSHIVVADIADFFPASLYTSHR